VVKRHFVTQQPLSVSYSAAVIVGKGGGGQWHEVTGVVGSGRHQALNQLLASDLLSNT